jgi:hypothetical protein
LNGAQWILLLAGTAAAAAFAYWLYVRREVPVAGRRALAATRAGTIAILLLLILDPSVPGDPAARRGGGTWVAVDLSLSMDAAPEGSRRPWERARERASELRESGATVAGFGDGMRFIAEDPDLLSRAPDAPTTRLAPLLERAIEAGASEVVVLSDLRFEDPVAVQTLLERPGLSVRFEEVGDSLVNAGVSGWRLPSAVGADERITGELSVFGSELSQGRTATVEVREGERLVFTGEVQLPGAGLLANVPVELPPAGERGPVRYEARVLLTEDAFAPDDARVVYTEVDPEEGLLVAVALTPDWELRFLLPILAQVTGLTTRGYVRVSPERYLPTGGDAGQGPVGSEEVRRRVEGAEMLVLQGLAGDDPEWLKDAAAQGRRVVVLPDDASGAAAAGVTAASPQTGEWYVSPELPASPLTGELVGASLQGLPPLGSVLPFGGQNDVEAPLRVQRGGSGAAEPALVLVSAETGRRAVMLANGFWRWAFREGAPRETYRRLWSGVAGWLLADTPAAGGAFVRPSLRVVPRGQPVQWSAGTLPGEEVHLAIRQGDSIVVDSAFAVPADGVFQSATLPPGSYAYVATSPARAGEEAQGVFDVEAHTAELSHPPARHLSAVTPGAAVELDQALGRRPLRTHPLPYFLLLGFLCGEWIGRRRKGLR